MNFFAGYQNSFPERLFGCEPPPKGEVRGGRGPHHEFLSFTLLVQDYVHGEPVEAEHVLDQKLGCLLGQGQLLEGHEVCHHELVNYGEYDTVPFRAGQANDKVQGDVGSRTAKNKQRLEDAHQGLAEGLVLTTEGGVVDVASGHPPP